MNTPVAFTKDVTTHNIPRNDPDEALRMIEEALKAPLPLPVQKFCSEIDKNFETTAVSLEITASNLERAAAELRKRANDLRDASPDVRGHVERWISFERESNERGKFLQSLFK